MAGFTPASPITGAPGTGLTSPTYTLVADAAPAQNAKQWYVSALGGTQTGVVVSSVNMPFTITVYKPAVFARIPPVNPITGVLPSAGKNVHAVITRKGVVVLAGQTPRIATYETKVSLPAGCESADFPNVVAGLSAHIGSLWEQSNEWADAYASGAL